MPFQERKPQGLNTAQKMILDEIKLNLKTLTSTITSRIGILKAEDRTSDDVLLKEHKESLLKEVTDEEAFRKKYGYDDDELTQLRELAVKAHHSASMFLSEAKEKALAEQQRRLRRP